MNTLRLARRLARLLLAWFTCAIAAAALAPVAAPEAAEVICSASGGTRAGDQDGDAGRLQGHRHDCALCAVFGLPPAAVAVFLPPIPFARERATLYDAPVVAHSAAPPGARGPPRG